MIKTKSKRQQQPRKAARKSPPPKKGTSGLLRNAGSAIGSIFGPVGGALGGIAGSALSKIFGFGQYTVESNSLMGIGSSAPVFGTGESIRVCKREYVCDINTSVDFDIVYSQIINPTNSQMFAWLAQIAGNFEECEFRGLVFEYVGTSGSAISTTSAPLGSVYMATQYNTHDAPFASKQQMGAYMYSTDTVPFRNALHGVECSRKQSVLQGKLFTAMTGADSNFYGLGTFSVATSGALSAYTGGELWVSYDIELFKPRASLTVPSLAGHFTSSITGLVTGSTCSQTYGTLSPSGDTTAAGISVAVSGSTLKFTIPSTYAGLAPGSQEFANCSILALFGHTATGNSSSSVQAGAVVSNSTVALDAFATYSSLSLQSTLGGATVAQAFAFQVISPNYANSVNVVLGNSFTFSITPPVWNWSASVTDQIDVILIITPPGGVPGSLTAPAPKVHRSLSDSAELDRLRALDLTEEEYAQVVLKRSAGRFVVV